MIKDVVGSLLNELREASSAQTTRWPVRKLSLPLHVRVTRVADIYSFKWVVYCCGDNVPSGRRQ